MSAPPAARNNGNALNVPPGQTPAAEGTLEQTPLLHLYVYLLDKSLTGTTVLTAPSGAVVGFVVQDGCVVRGQTRDGTVATDRATLERSLVDLCLLPADTRYGFYPRHDFFADADGPRIVIEPLAVIMSAARACVGSTFASATLRKVMKASTVKVAEHATPERFRLSPEERALIERIRKQALTLPELISSSGVPEQIVRGVIYGLTITRHLDFGIPARPPVGLEVLPRAAAIPAARSSNPGANSGTTASRVNSGTTASNPLIGTLTDPNHARTKDPERAGPVVKYSPLQDPPPMRPRLNSELEILDTGPASTKPASQRIVETAPLDKRRTQVESKITRIDMENHFEVLGIKETATLLEIRDAYFGMAKVFHPDRLVDMPDLRPKAQAAFARISAAYNELSDDKKRAAYINKLHQADGQGQTNTTSRGDQATIGRAVNAALEAQKAELFLKKNELAAAETHAKMASLADPDQPAYTALLVWIQALQRPAPAVEDGKTTPAYDDLITTLNQLLNKEPSFERALFYRGVLYQRSGHMEKAFKDFSKALELNPRNIDAAREVRLYKLRNEKPEEAPQNKSGGGLFGKLFKR